MGWLAVRCCPVMMPAKVCDKSKGRRQTELRTEQIKEEAEGGQGERYCPDDDAGKSLPGQPTRVQGRAHAAAAAPTPGTSPFDRPAR